VGVRGGPRHGKMSAMQHVWIVSIAQDYESTDPVGIFISKQNAVAAAMEYMARHHDYANTTPDVDNDNEVRWRFSDQFTLSAVRCEVKP
jgi:hypothetical protein